MVLKCVMRDGREKRSALRASTQRGSKVEWVRPSLRRSRSGGERAMLARIERHIGNHIHRLTTKTCCHTLDALATPQPSKDFGCLGISPMLHASEHHHSILKLGRLGVELARLQVQPLLKRLHLRNAFGRHIVDTLGSASRAAVTSGVLAITLDTVLVVSGTSESPGASSDGICVCYNTFALARRHLMHAFLVSCRLRFFAAAVALLLGCASASSLWSTKGEIAASSPPRACSPSSSIWEVPSTDGVWPETLVRFIVSASEPVGA